MRPFSTALANHYASAAGIDHAILIWISARHRGTGEVGAIGLWSGDDARVFNVSGAPRTYYGAGALLDFPPLSFGTGTNVRDHEFVISALHPAVQLALREYEPRLAPIEVHRVPMDGAAVIADPYRVFSGEVDEVTFTTDAEGNASCKVVMVSAAVHLTRPLYYLRSDQARRAAYSGDRMLQYAGAAGVVKTYWGEKRAKDKSKGSQG